MFLDVLGFFKTTKETGEEVTLRFGDTGKTVVRPLPEDGSDLEENYLYAADAEETSGAVGEVSNFQINPEWDGNVDSLQAGDAFIYTGKDLL